MAENPEFLKAYRTHEKPEAIRAAQRKEKRTGQKGITRDRTERIKAYLERLENIFLNPDQRVRERNIELLKPAIYENALIREENFPESYFEFQKQQLVDKGISKEQVEREFSQEKKKEEISRVRESQRLSLDAWIDYLSGDNCKYPTDLKYFVMQGVFRLGNFNTGAYSFTKRIETTTAPFPEVDRQALSIILGGLEARHYNKPTENYSPALLDLIDKNKNFDDLYALAMREIDQMADKSEILPITEGEWRIFKKGSNPQKLVDALAGIRSNLCIADIGSATDYLNQGSVEIYFSHNSAKQPVVPRIAIARNDNVGVYEVRGTYNKNEDMDLYIEETDILINRLKNIPNGESFAKKDADMKRMTKLYNRFFKIDKKTKEKTNLNPELTRDDLSFLYEIDDSIDGFGYQKDPRIEEITNQRKIKEDLAFLFNCRPDQISTTKDEALKGDIIFHYGDLYLDSLTSAEGLKLPEKIGSLYLDSLTSAEGLKLPEKISGILYLNSLTSAEGLKLPEKISGILNLDSLTHNQKEILRRRYPNLEIL